MLESLQVSLCYDILVRIFLFCWNSHAVFFFSLICDRGNYTNKPLAAGRNWCWWGKVVLAPADASLSPSGHRVQKWVCLSYYRGFLLLLLGCWYWGWPCFRTQTPPVVCFPSLFSGRRYSALKWWGRVMLLPCSYRGVLHMSKGCWHRLVLLTIMGSMKRVSSWTGWFCRSTWRKLESSVEEMPPRCPALRHFLI